MNIYKFTKICLYTYISIVFLLYIVEDDWYIISAATLCMNSYWNKNQTQGFLTSVQDELCENKQNKPKLAERKICLADNAWN